MSQGKKRRRARLWTILVLSTIMVGHADSEPTPPGLEPVAKRSGPQNAKPSNEGDAVTARVLRHRGDGQAESAFVPRAAATLPPALRSETGLAAPEHEVIEGSTHELERRDSAKLQRTNEPAQVLDAAELDRVVAGAAARRPSLATVSSLPSSDALVAPPGAPRSWLLAQAQIPAQAPPAAPGELAVDEGAAERALERTLVEQGALLLPFGAIELQPSFTYTRIEDDFFVQDGNTLLVVEGERNEFTPALSLLFGLPLRSQLELDFPYNYVTESFVTGFDQEEDQSGSGFGELAVGLATNFLREGPWWPDLVGRVTWDSDIGNENDGDVFLNGGFHEIRGALTALKRQDPLAFVGEVSYEYAFESDNDRPGNELGFAIGTFLAASPDTSLRLVLNQTFADEFELDGNSIDGSDQVLGTLTIGAASVLGAGSLIDVSVDIGLTDDAPDYAARIAIPIRFSIF